MDEDHKRMNPDLVAALRKQFGSGHCASCTKPIDPAEVFCDVCKSSES